MHTIDLTLAAPQLNLALDEALLIEAEEGRWEETLRFWESPVPFVVLGYSNKIATEVNVRACAARGVPVSRRCTGGGTVLQGPGCLNYALVLRADENGPLGNVTAANCFIMKRNRDALQPLVSERIEIEGHTDLAIGGVKFSGNSQRRGRRWLLFHGTFLHRFDLSLLEQLLPLPSRQPSYRTNRPHAAFLRNIDLTVEAIKAALMRGWNATIAPVDLPSARTEHLAATKYSSPDWTERF